MVTCFIVIIAEDWNQTMYLYVRALDVDGGRTLAITYFIALFILGNTILLALFTALLLRSQDDELKKLENKIEEKAERTLTQQLTEDALGPCDALKKKCSRKSCTKKCTSFADSFVRIFGGDIAYVKRV